MESNNKVIVWNFVCFVLYRAQFVLKHNRLNMFFMSHKKWEFLLANLVSALVWFSIVYSQLLFYE